MSEPVESKAIKLITAALQRQRNAANDKIVDLEVSIALKEALYEELAAAYLEANKTIDNLRDIIADKTKQIEQLEALVVNVSDEADVSEEDSPAPEQKTEVESQDTSTDSENTEILESSQTPVITGVTQVLEPQEPELKPDSDSGFEDAVVHKTPEKNTHGKKSFFTKGK